MRALNYSFFCRKTEFNYLPRNSGPKTVPCDKCNYKAAQKHGLILHTKSEHEGGIFSILLASQTNIAHNYIELCCEQIAHVVEGFVSELPYNHIAHKYIKLQYEQITHVVEDFISELSYSHIAHNYI